MDDRLQSSRVRRRCESRLENACDFVSTLRLGGGASSGHRVCTCEGGPALASDAPESLKRSAKRADIDSQATRYLRGVFTVLLRARALCWANSLECEVVPVLAIAVRPTRALHTSSTS